MASPITRVGRRRLLVLAAVGVCAAGVVARLAKWPAAERRQPPAPPSAGASTGTGRTGLASAPAAPTDSARASTAESGSSPVAKSGSADAAPAQNRAVSPARTQATEPAGSPLTVEGLQAEAFAMGRQALRDFPDSTGPLVLMAKIDHQFGNRAEAVQWWQKVLKLSLDGPAADPRTAAAAYTRMGVIAVDRGNYQQAADLFRKARQIDRRQPGVSQRLGHALLQLGRAEEAAQVVEEGIRLHPKAKTPFRLLGQIQLELKQFDRAAASFEKAIAVAPDDSRAYYGLTIAYTRLGQKEKARQYQQRFRQLRAERGQAERAERKAANDLNWMRRAVAPLHRYAAGIYLQQRRPREGERHLRRAAELDPKDLVCRQRLVDFYMAQRRPADALGYCQQLRQLAPQVASYHLNAGVMLASLRRFDAAEQALRQGVRLAPERPGGYESLVQVLLLGTHNDRDAQTMAEKLVTLRPSGMSWYLVCLAREANKDLSGALAAIEKAWKLEPGNEKIRRARQRLRARGGG